MCGKPVPYPEAEKFFSQIVILQHKLYYKVKVGCKGLTGIQQTVALWRGGDSCDGQVKVCDAEFYIKHAELLAFGNVC
jgi:hypothetical protein